MSYLAARTPDEQKIYFSRRRHILLIYAFHIRGMAAHCASRRPQDITAALEFRRVSFSVHVLFLETAAREAACASRSPFHFIIDFNNSRVPLFGS